MGDQLPKPLAARRTRFYLLSSLPDDDPIVMERGCHAIDVAPSI
jgi:hypothetical protein